MGSRRGSHYDADGFVDAIRKQIYVNVEEKENDSRGGRGGRGGKGGSAAVRYERASPSSFLLFILDLPLLALFCTCIAQKKKTHTHTCFNSVNDDDNCARDGGNVDRGETKIGKTVLKKYFSIAVWKIYMKRFIPVPW